jgi:fused signal recognition particle receptor
MSFFGIFGKPKQQTLDSGLEKTKESLLGKLTRAIAGKHTIDDDVLDSLEETLITSDVGTDTTLEIIKRIQARVAKDKYLGTSELKKLLCEEISAMLSKSDKDAKAETQKGHKPYVILVVGVNGVGKTTTIAKLAYMYKKAGLKVMLGAADTFRAAAIEQLSYWGEKVGVPVVKQQMGSDPASVAFDTLHSALASDIDVVLIDTAGRLHNKVSLMRELGKIRNVVAKVVPTAPDEVLLVLDGSTGQNAYQQAAQFVAATEVNSIAVTKLDGTAKGGVVIGISHQFKIPVKYIGLGEKMEDLQPFDAESYVKTLLG